MPDFQGDFGGTAIRSAATEAIRGEMQRLNKTRFTGLTKLQRELTEKAGKVYIYNVSPIHEWSKPQGQLGTVMITKCEKGKQVSRPYVLNGIINRWYDKGLGRKELFQESGIEVAEDICGCSKEFPSENANNNLTNFGVFITLAPFDELPKKKQDELLEAAREKMLKKLQDLVLEADLFHQSGNSKWVGQIHRDALQSFNELTGAKQERPWAPIRYAEKAEDCKFCGSSVKPGVVVCPTCRNVLDESKYKQMGGKKES